MCGAPPTGSNRHWLHRLQVTTARQCAAIDRNRRHCHAFPRRPCVRSDANGRELRRTTSPDLRRLPRKYRSQTVAWRARARIRADNDFRLRAADVSGDFGCERGDWSGSAYRVVRRRIATMVKRRIKTALFIASVALNLILAAIAGNLWLQKRARDLGLPSSSEALRSLAGASVLPSVRIEFRVAEEQPGTGLTPVATNDYPPTLYLHSDVAVSNGDIHGAKAGRD